MAQASKKTAKPNPLQRFLKYLREVRAELKRVVWPTRPEVVNSSVVVITTLIIFTAFVSLVDFIASTAILDWLAKIGR
jgi:preprotein translocase subunit SecE